MTLFFLMLLIGAHRPPANPKYYKTKALPGDGIYSLLRRYGLDRNSCNVSKFYALNDLKNGSLLKVGIEYQLPIMIYDFDGKTIRSSVGIKDWQTAKSIETYNENMLKDGYRQKSFKIDKSLWVPYHILNCPDTDVKQAALDDTASNGEVNLAIEPSGNRRFPIFGKKYEHVPLLDNSLAGRVYYIESGHGGPDPGAMATVAGHTVCEDEYAYDVALRVVRKLIEHGATAYMITRDRNDGIRDGQYLVCDNDEVVWGNESIFRGQKPRLFQRSDVINNLYEKHLKQGVVHQKLVVIHVDSRGKGQQTDLFFYYHPDDKEGKALATQMHKSMEENYKKVNKKRGYKGTVTARDLHMLRETKVPAAYIELGNIKHPTDQKRLFIAANRQLIADWLYDGMKW
ncbi:MAG: N-acetylmuramoyl-L-alanine amidase [Bacteroidetes bacterium]|nr:N-acetylmuramoyl-L-alanine amidase [Bacteroidota bacterium]